MQFLLKEFFVKKVLIEKWVQFFVAVQEVKIG
jgi:hypothetical protein